MSLPLNIVTGFLGAGKTTLLQRALERGVLGRTALLVNEFGAADIDGALLAGAAAGAPLLRLPNGCVCCRVQEDFIAAVRALGARVATGELALDRIVLETSGLADPAPLLAHLLAARPLREVVGAVRVLTVVDGVQGERALAEHVEARHQLACADLIVLSKADRLDAAAFRHWHDTTLPTYGAQAAVVASSGGWPEDPQWLSRLDAAGWTPAGVRPAERTRPRERPDIHGTAHDPGHAHDRHDHDHDHDHDHAPGHGHAPDAHGPAAHSHGIASFHLRCGPLASREQWQGWASTLLLLHAEQLLRLKGFVAFAGEPQRQVLQGAMDGLRLDPWSGEDQPGVASAAATEVVAIARGMDAWRHRDGLRRALLAIAADAALEP